MVRRVPVVQVSPAPGIFCRDGPLQANQVALGGIQPLPVMALNLADPGIPASPA
jgi:hypothetical protein